MPQRRPRGRKEPPRVRPARHEEGAGAGEVVLRLAELQLSAVLQAIAAVRAIAGFVLSIDLAVGAAFVAGRSLLGPNWPIVLGGVLVFLLLSLSMALGAMVPRTGSLAGYSRTGPTASEVYRQAIDDQLTRDYVAAILIDQLGEAAESNRAQLDHQEVCLLAALGLLFCAGFWAGVQAPPLWELWLRFFGGGLVVAFSLALCLGVLYPGFRRAGERAFEFLDAKLGPSSSGHQGPRSGSDRERRS